MRAIIEPYKKYKNIDLIQLAKEHLLDFYQKEKLLIVLNSVESSQINLEYLSHITNQSDVYFINNQKFIIELFDTDIYSDLKDIRILGIKDMNKIKLIRIENLIKNKTINTKKNLLKIVDIFYYSENFFETVTLLEN